MDREALLELQSPYLFSLHSAQVWFDLLPDFLRDSNDGVSGTLGGRMRCNPETTPPWEPIAAALARGQKWTRAARSRLAEWTAVGDGGVRVGDHGCARVRAAKGFISPKAAGAPIYL